MAISPDIYLISSVLRGQDYPAAVAAGVNADMFHACKAEWEWIESYVTRYRRAPSKAAFRRHFPDFRIKAVDDTAHFVDEVRKNHARSVMTRVLRETTDLIADGRIDDAIVLSKKSIIDVSATMGGVQDTDVLSDWKGIYTDVAARVARFNEFGMAGIPTGFDTLDERTGGVGPGQSWIVGMRLGEGKSWMLLKMACSAIIAGHTVHFSALEMSRVEVSMRLHNMLSGAVGKEVFRSQDLAQGRDFDLGAYKAFLRDLKGLIKGSLTVSDANRIGAEEIAAQVERHQPDLYLLDYLTLASTKGDGGWMDVGNFSKDLKTIAKDYQLGMVSAAQLNREHGIGKEPAGPEALSMSDAIGQDADAVITGKKMSDSIVKLKMAKYRHGNSGYTWYNHMDLSKGVIKEVSKNEALKIMDRDADAQDARG